jgi:hypothetical protein
MPRKANGPWEPALQQPEQLARVASVHRAFLQQVRVNAVDHGGGLLDQRLAIRRGHRVAVDDGPEFRQRVNCPEIVFRREPGCWNGQDQNPL